MLWEIQQEGKIDEVPFGFLYNQSCRTQASTVCVRAAPLGGQSLGALQSINSGFTNIGEQNVSGLDLNAVYTGFELQGNQLVLRLDYSYTAEFERVELNPADLVGALRDRDRGYLAQRDEGAAFARPVDR